MNYLQNLNKIPPSHNSFHFSLQIQLISFVLFTLFFKLYIIFLSPGYTLLLIQTLFDDSTPESVVDVISSHTSSSSQSSNDAPQPLSPHTTSTAPTTTTGEAESSQNQPTPTTEDSPTPQNSSSSSSSSSAPSESSSAAGESGVSASGESVRVGSALVPPLHTHTVTLDLTYAESGRLGLSEGPSVPQLHAHVLPFEYARVGESAETQSTSEGHCSLYASERRPTQHLRPLPPLLPLQDEDVCYYHSVYLYLYISITLTIYISISYYIYLFISLYNSLSLYLFSL